MAIQFPDPAGQTPANTFSPTSTPNANTENNITYVWDGSAWNGSAPASAVPPLQNVLDAGNTSTTAIASSADIAGAQLEGTSLYANGGGVPLLVNSTDSNNYKIQLDDAGTASGYIGAATGVPFKIGNKTATNLFDMDDNGNMSAINTYSGTSANLTGNVTANGYVYAATNAAVGNGSSVGSAAALNVVTTNKTQGIWCDISNSAASYGAQFRARDGNNTQYAVYGLVATSSSYASAGALFYSINSNTYTQLGYWSTSAYYGVYTNGQIYGTSVYNASDERLKNFSGQVENVLDKLDAINAYYYTWKDNSQVARSSSGRTEIGLSAQEVQAQFPEVVNSNKQQKVTGVNPATMEEELGETLSVDYGRMSSILIQAVKELRQEINALKGV